MESSHRYPSQKYQPSAPSLPDNYGHDPNSPPPPPRFTAQQSFSSSHSHQLNYPQPQPPPPYGHGCGYPSSSSYPAPPNYGGEGFPPGTHPEIIRSFQMVDKDRSGFIDERELQEALSYGYHKFSIRTAKLLIFLFANPTSGSLQIGPKEFSALWTCIGEWRAIFEKFDRDHSGKFDTVELRDALYSLGYAIPPSVLQVLVTKYEDGSGRRGELNFDSFVECGMIIKGLTEKFKEKDSRYTGSATLNYDTFMSTVIPFIVP